MGSVTVKAPAERLVERESFLGMEGLGGAAGAGGETGHRKA
jgi:hypothetical protein